MNSTPGRLRGSGIRNLPVERVPAMLDRLKQRHHKTFRVRTARYRITGFRDPNTGGWVSRDPKNGHYYLQRAGSGIREFGKARRYRTKLRPTKEILARSPMLSLEVEIDRGKGPRIYYLSLRGPLR